MHLPLAKGEFDVALTLARMHYVSHSADVARYRATVWSVTAAARTISARGSTGGLGAIRDNHFTGSRDREADRFFGAELERPAARRAQRTPPGL